MKLNESKIETSIREIIFLSLLCLMILENGDSTVKRLEDKLIDKIIKVLGENYYYNIISNLTDKQYQYEDLKKYAKKYLKEK